VALLELYKREKNNSCNITLEKSNVGRNHFPLQAKDDKAPLYKGAFQKRSSEFLFFFLALLSFDYLY